MAFTKEQLIALYRRRAKRYDLSANLYRVIGFREPAYRRIAVTKLELKAGDTVLEIGCGTGLNLPLLREAVGPTGRVIGIDLTDRMLDEARKRVARHGWGNVELVQADAATFHFPAGLNGVISTFALTLVPEYERVIRNAASALIPGRRLIILDLKQPDRMPIWLVRLAVLISKPFGVTLDLTERRPWDSVVTYFGNVTIEELYFGFAYLACGEKIGPPP